jgi:hypothetical protein
MIRTYQAYMFCAMMWGPLGLLIAHTALSLAEPERKILGVVVPFKRVS